MLNTQKRARKIIINECLTNNLDMEHIEIGCTHAEYLVGQEVSFGVAIHAGIEVAHQDKLNMDARKRKASMLRHLELIKNIKF